ncbi:MAG TPA: helix-turn-helix domain-containing protein [Streptosporangiaceae bacterium]|nr:helix-turn-helix domain-containing protein [Streptosporangiaceae bacterium]
MTAIVERTVLPPEHPEGLTSVLALLAPDSAGRATLIGPDGTRLELPGEVFDVLREVVSALSRGLAITVAPHQTVLSTSEAAQLLGVSRPTLVRLLESGEIPFDKPGRHRRVRLADLLAYQQRSRRRRASLLDQMVADAEDAGLYDLPGEAPFERLPRGDDQRPG